MAMSVTEALTTDHRELEANFQNIMNAQDYDTATRWQNQFVWELARHSVGEELVVYPAFEQHLGQKGKSIADKDRLEHLQIKKDLQAFQNLSYGHPDFKPCLEKLIKDFRDHVKEEEGDDLPALEKAISGDETARIANSFERTKMFAPSRSHPSAPDKPPFETAAGLLAAPIDKLMDLFRRFPDENTPRVK